MNTTLNKLRMLQYFIAVQIFLDRHIPSNRTLTKLYLSTYCAEDFKPHYMNIYIFYLSPSFPMIWFG